MFWQAIVMTLMVLFTRDNDSIELIEIRGKVTCDGEPVAGVQILMIDDNIWVLDHILNYRSTNKHGSFNLRGKPNDKDLDLVLVVEHSCHENKNTRTGKKVESYSNYRIPLHTLEENRYNLTYNIELRENDGVHNSWPALHAWRTMADIKTGISENANKFKDYYNKNEDF